MAAGCFCGCGREIPRFPLGSRSINKRGQLVRERLGWAQEVFGDDGPERFGEWFDEGEEHVEDIAAALHGEIDPRSLNERAVRHWMSYGRKIERAVLGMGGPSVNAWTKAERNRQAYGS